MLSKYSLYCLSLAVTLAACTKNQGDKVSLPDQQIAQKPAAAEVPSQPQAGAGPAEKPVPGVAPAANQEVPPPSPAPVARDESSMQTRLTGQVSSQKKTNLAFRVGGFLQELKVKPGDPCKKGDVLATLDARDYKLARDLARSQRDLARVGLDNAKSEFEREEQLRRENVSTASMFDKLKAAFDNARLNLQIAELNLTKADQALQDTMLLAPYNCVITKQMKFLGENVPSGTAVFEIYDTSDIELDFPVPERLAGKLKVGDPIQVTIPATGYTGSVEIVRLVPVVEQSSRTFRIIVRAPQDERVVPGLYAEAVLR